MLYGNPSAILHSMIERPRPPIETEDGRRPFVIRGHHLGLFTDLAKGNITPDDLSSKLKTEMQNDLDVALFSRKHFSFKEHVLQQIRYGHDVLGYTAEDANKVETNDLKIFEKFTELPSDYPVDIVEGQKDEICKGCIVGKHCTLRDSEDEFGPGSAVEADEFFVNYFLRDTKKLSPERHHFDAIKEYVEFSDAKTQKMRRIKTTAGVVKSVLASWEDI